MAKLETSSEEIDEKRYRNFMILLYNDTTSYSYKDVLSDLKGSFKNYAYINHRPEEDEKKEHTHFVLSLDNARTISSLSSRVGIPMNFIQPIKSLRASCRYLIHADNDEKIQYDLSDVKVSSAFSRKFYCSFDDLKTEEDIISDIFNYIDCLSGSYFSIIKDLTIFINQNAYDTIYKRYRNEFLDYLKSKVL